MPQTPTLSPQRITEPTNAAQAPAFRRHLLWILLLWAAIYIPALFRPALLDDADSAHAEAAREMITRHDWVTLHLDGIRYLEKAPLLYWGMATSFEVFGVREWSARLPLYIGVLALLLTMERMGRRAYGAYGGLLAAIVTATAVGPFLFTRILIPDILVALWLALAMMFFAESLQEPAPSRLTCWGIAVSCALNVLTKGLIGLVFPIGAIVIFLLLTGDLKRLLKMHLVSSFFLFLTIAAPWHILAGLRNPTQGSIRGFFWFYFVNEHFLRYLNKRVPRDYDTVPLLLFWGLMLVWLLPWSSFAFQSIAQIPHRWKQLQARMSRSERMNLLCGIWAALVLVFFSFSTRQEYYVLPAVPAVGLLIAGWLARESNSEAQTRIRRTGVICSSVLFALAAAVFVAAVVLVATSQPAHGRDISDALTTGLSESSKYALSLGHMEDLTTRSMGYFRLPLLLFGGGLLLGAGCSWYFRRRGLVPRANASLALGMVPVLWAVQMGLITFSPVISSKLLAQDIARAGVRPGDIVEINGEYESGSTLNFYLEREVRILNGRSSNLWYGSFFPDAPKTFDDNASFSQLWNGPKRVFLLSPKMDVPKIAANGLLVGESGGKVVLSNR
jgi:4-amino-4-deoxy-L-arabinose transferase-like glycosyltransferase